MASFPKNAFVRDEDLDVGEGLPPNELDSRNLRQFLSKIQEENSVSLQEIKLSKEVILKMTREQKKGLINKRLLNVVSKEEKLEPEDASVQSSIKEIDVHYSESLSDISFNFKSAPKIKVKEPIQIAEAPPREPSENNDEGCECQPRILVIDDNQFNIMAVQVMIKENFQLETDQALNGELGVAAYKEGFDRPCGCENRAHKLIFMDVSMPVMGGIEASKLILEM